MFLGMVERLAVEDLAEVSLYWHGWPRQKINGTIHSGTSNSTNMSGAVWLNLANFYHFGKKLKTCGNFLRVYLVFGKIVNLLWQIIFYIEQIYCYKRPNIELIILLSGHTGQESNFPLSFKWAIFGSFFITFVFFKNSTPAKNLLLKLLMPGFEPGPFDFRIINYATKPLPQN